MPGGRGTTHLGGSTVDEGPTTGTRRRSHGSQPHGPGHALPPSASPRNGPEAGENSMMSKAVTWAIGLFLLGVGVPAQVSAQAIVGQGKVTDGKTPAAPVYIDVRSVLS